MKFNYRNWKNEILTSVCVDNRTGKITFTNYTDDVVERVFGYRTEEDVIMDDLMRFFERRTYPRNRTDIKSILHAMGLEEYDPYLMCKKLQGRTEQDGNWIEFLED